MVDASCDDRAVAELLHRDFVRLPEENDYHRGKFTWAGGDELRWENVAGRSWGVTLRRADDNPDKAEVLETGDDCPYQGKHFEVQHEPQLGVRFGGELYEAQEQEQPHHVVAEPKVDSEFGKRLEELFEHDFVRHPEENEYHRGKLCPGEDEDTIFWENAAGVRWTLQVLRDEDGRIKAFRTGQDCAYNRDPEDPEILYILRNDAGDPVCLEILGEAYYVEDVCDAACEERNAGLHGYVSMALGGNDNEHHMGYSSYTSIWKLRGDLPVLGSMQIGLPGSWIIPDNSDFEGELCPPDTKAHEWKERGPVYRDVFQTVEGGPGFWCSTQFPSKLPKYRINGTPNGYNHEISSPLFGFGKTTGLDPEQLGILQISNKLVIPPDGITFRGFNGGRRIGNSWAALPLLESYTQEDDTPVGNNTWTLFLNAANFKGPVAGWLPDTWAQLSRSHPSIHGRGLDARPGINSSVAMEVNTVPFFQDGSKIRVPQLAFPNDRDGGTTTTLVSDVRAFSKDVVWNNFEAWAADPSEVAFEFQSEGVLPLKGSTQPFTLSIGPRQSRAKMENMSSIVTTGTGPSKDSFQLHWGAGKSRKKYRQLPALFESNEGHAHAVEPTECSKSLCNSPFHPSVAVSSSVYETSIQVEGDGEECTTETLSDGSVVTYRWVRFVDQPTFALREWREGEKEHLQSLIEELHKGWSIDKDYLEAPSDNDGFKLVKLDWALLVDPPSDKAYGYVPIAIRQEAAAPH